MPEAKAVGFSSSKPARLIFSELLVKRCFPLEFPSCKFYFIF